VDRSILDPAPFHPDQCSRGPSNLLEAARQVWESAATGMQEKRFHHVSSDEVFGIPGYPDSPPFNEATPLRSPFPYSASKAASDHLARAYFHTYDLPVTITNCSNNYRSLSIPGEADSSDDPERPAGKASADLRRWEAGSRLAICGGPLRRRFESLWSVGHRVKRMPVGGGNQPHNIDLVRELCSHPG